MCGKSGQNSDLVAAVYNISVCAESETEKKLKIDFFPCFQWLVAKVGKILILLLQYIIYQCVLKVKLKKAKDRFFPLLLVVGLQSSKGASLFFTFFFFLSWGLKEFDHVTLAKFYLHGAYPVFTCMPCRWQQP